MSASSKTGLLVVGAIGLVVFGAIAVVVIQAQQKKQPVPSQPLPELSPEKTSYDVAGRITRLPSADNPDMEIQHEAIPTFTNGKGKVVGMGAMNMPFPVSDEVDLSGFEVGDDVEFTFDVWWTPDPAWQLTTIRKAGD